MSVSEKISLLPRRVRLDCISCMQPQFTVPTGGATGLCICSSPVYMSAVEHIQAWLLRLQHYLLTLCSSAGAEFRTAGGDAHQNAHDCNAFREILANAWLQPRPQKWSAERLEDQINWLGAGQIAFTEAQVSTSPFPFPVLNWLSLFYTLQPSCNKSE